MSRLSSARPRIRQKLSRSSPDTLASLQTASSLSPCSPMMKAWTFRLSTPSSSPSSCLSRPVSSTVPEPMTRSLG